MMSSVTLVSITLAAVIALAVGLLIGFALQKKLVFRRRYAPPASVDTLHPST